MRSVVRLICVRYNGGFPSPATAVTHDADDTPSPAPVDATSDQLEVEGEPSSGAPTLSLPTVSELLAVPASTILAWERLHVAPAVGQDAQGQREYTVSDVAALRRLRDERATGADADNPVAVGAPPAPLTLCRRLLSAAHGLQSAQVGAALDRSLEALGLPRTIDDVLLPSMREIGTRRSDGPGASDEERLATNAVLSWLRRKATQAPPPRDPRPVVLTCGPLDQHTVALDALEVLLRYDGFDCRNMGAQTPVASLRAGIDHCSAQAVVLVSELIANRAPAASALRAVDRNGVAVFYAGAAFRSQASRRGLPGTYLRGNLGQAAADIRARLGTPSAP